MIRGIGNNPYGDLSKFLDYTEFEALYPEIAAGIAVCKHTIAIEGNYFKYDIHDQSSFKSTSISPLSSYEKLKNDSASLKNDKIKTWVENKGKTLKDTNTLTRLLKSKYRAYDPTWLIHLTEAPWFEDCIAEDVIYWNHQAMKLFPETIKWVNDKVSGNIFEEGIVKMIAIVYLENDGIPVEHRDGSHNKDNVSTREECAPADQMIHLRNPQRGFYIFDPDTRAKVFIDTWASVFNTNDWHSTYRSLYPSWSLRIDGQFTQKVKDHLGEYKWNT